MKLYSSKTSPFARKVRVLLLECGLHDQVKEIFVSGSPLASGTMPVSDNPLGKIPTLVIEDGTALFDSRVICRYLSDRASWNGYPAGEVLWRKLALEALADGIMEAALLCVYEVRLRPEHMRSEAWVEGQWAKIERSLARTESGYMDLLLEPLDMPAIALSVALAYLDFRHAGRDWRVRHRRLAEWHDVTSRRSSFLNTEPHD